MRALRIVLLALVIHGCVRIAPDVRSYQDGDAWCTETRSAQGSSLYCEPLNGEWEVR